MDMSLVQAMWTLGLLRAEDLPTTAVEALECAHSLFSRRLGREQRQCADAGGDARIGSAGRGDRRLALNFAHALDPIRGLALVVSYGDDDELVVQHGRDEIVWKWCVDLENVAPHAADVDDRSLCLPQGSAWHAAAWLRRKPQTRGRDRAARDRTSQRPDRTRSAPA